VAICFVGIGGEDLATQNTDALRYLALINTARSGELSSKGTYELFGAVAQQCLSVIASGKKFVNMRSLLSTFEKIRYVDRPTLELIVNGLLHLGYIRRDGIKNQFGPADRLHKLVKAMRIYGNFPIESHKVKLFNGDQELGNVPLFNFGRRIGVGSHVTFRAQRWKIRKITPLDFPEVVEMERYEGKVPCEKFHYKGAGIGFETFLNEKMWGMIHENDFPSELLIGDELRKTVTEARDSVRSMCKIREIPYCAVRRGNRELHFRYYTFGGALVNRAVGLITEQEDYEEDDLWLDVHSPIDWKTLPTKPDDYEPIFEKMFRQSADQSIFQLMLPLELQIREYTQEWLKDDAVRQVLSRLASSTPVEISLQNWPFG
jgi:ATP-dependent helicase Lhr and Lhr-like helicase